MSCVVILMNVCCYITVAMVWRSFSVKGFGIYEMMTVAVAKLLKEVYYLQVLQRSTIITTSV